jgi:sarcosine oxidase, subunit beta
MTEKKSCDVIVVGGGIIGAALADRLVSGRAGEGGSPLRGRVTLLEKESSWCTGTSARSAGGIRRQFDVEHKIRAAAYSVAYYDDFFEKYGEDPVLKRHGYLILATTDKSAAALRSAARLQVSLGIDARILTPDEVGGLVPPLNTSDVKGGVFSPRDGYLDPHALVQGYIKRFKARGGCVVTDCRVERFSFSAGRIGGVETTKGTFEADAVVVAAGPFSGALLKRAGVDVPLRPCRRQIFSSARVSGVDEHWPLVLDPDNGFYFRPETGGVIMSIAEIDEMEPPERGNDIPVSRDSLPELAARAAFRCPILAEARISSGWAGLRTITPDEAPLLGAVPPLDGLFLAAGFSGYGITLSHFAAEAVASAVEGREPDCGDPSPFLPARYL